MAELALCVFLIALGALLWNLGRAPGESPATLWVLGWVAVGSALVAWVARSFAWGPPLSPLPWAPTLGPLPPATYLVGPVLPGLCLAGALVYAERSVPRWLLPAAFGLGLLRWGLALAGTPTPGHVLALALEPAALVGAATVAFQATRSDDATGAQRALAPSFLAIAAVEALTALWELRGLGLTPGLLSLWLVVGPPSIALQITAASQRSGRQRRAVERGRERAQADLRASEERFRLMAEQASDLICECSPDGRFLYASHSFAETLGYPPEELIGQDAFAPIHPEDRSAGVSGFMRAVERVGASEATFRYRHADGRWCWLEVKARGFRVSNGELRVVVAARDVTRRRQEAQGLREDRDLLERRVAERTAELRVSQERYRAVSELSSDLNFAVRLGRDGEYEMEWVTLAAERITGYGVDEIVRDQLQFIHPDDREGVLHHFLAVCEGESRSFEARIVTKAGEVRWLQSHITSAPCDVENQVRIIGASRDITERVEAVRQRRLLDLHLASVQRLESLGVLAGGIAHDFNNVLNVILGNSAIVLSDLEEDSPLRKRVAQIRSAARHAAGLTEQMLTYSGRSALSLKPLHLPQVAAASVELLEAGMAGSCVLETELAEQVPPIAADETQVRQVMVNLVTNASEALEPGSGCVRLRVTTLTADRALLADSFGTPDLPEGDYVCLEVSDDGPGIDPARHAQIFEPFFSTRFAGRGLGLAAVLGIVRGHGGTIHLASQPGAGTRFRVLFPIGTELARDEPAAADREAHGRSVLVIDDDEAVLELAAELLRRAGFAPETCRGGREGLALLERRADEIDAVVLDVAMPDMDGEATYQGIRRIRPDLPVILASGYDRDRKGERFSAQRIAGFVRKPYEPEELVETVRASLDTAPA